MVGFATHGTEKPQEEGGGFGMAGPAQCLYLEAHGT